MANEPVILNVYDMVSKKQADAFVSRWEVGETILGYDWARESIMMSQAACMALGWAESPEPLVTEKLLLPIPGFLQKVLCFEGSPSHQTKDAVKNYYWKYSFF